MTRRQIIISASIVAILIAAAAGLWLLNRNQAAERDSPAWLDPQQPPEGIAGRVNTLTPEQSWAANRALHMSASCGGGTAGSRVRRTYAGTLASNPDSVVC